MYTLLNLSYYQGTNYKVLYSCDIHSIIEYYCAVQWKFCASFVTDCDWDIQQSEAHDGAP